VLTRDLAGLSGPLGPHWTCEVDQKWIRTSPAARRAAQGSRERGPLAQPVPAPATRAGSDGRRGASSATVEFEGDFDLARGAAPRLLCPVIIVEHVSDVRPPR
jgi:hypothetical protein